MKTTTDIAAFLKRTGAKLTLSYDDETGKFLAWTAVDECPSKYLDESLDGLQESYRRRANGMQVMRAAESPPSTPLPPQKPPFQGSPSISTAAQVAYQAGQCPSCGKNKVGIMGTATGSYFFCSLGHYWLKP